MVLLFPVDESANGSICELSSARRPTSQVEQLLMLVSHVTGCFSTAWVQGCVADDHDVGLLDQYAWELLAMPTVGTWLMLYHEGYDQMTRVRLSDSAHLNDSTANATAKTTSSSCSGGCADGVIAWGEPAI